MDIYLTRVIQETRNSIAKTLISFVLLGRIHE